MTHEYPNPPGWAETLLRSLLPRSERDAISGDLLEEYRAVRRPSLGPAGANLWYLEQVASVLWQLIRPFALAFAGIVLVALTLKDRPEFNTWPYYVKDDVNGGALLGGLVSYVWAGFNGARRTRLVRTGILAAGSTSFVGLTIGFLYEAMRSGEPVGFIIFPLFHPFMFVILAVLLGQAVAVGTVAGAVGRWLARTPRANVRIS